jgi:hypothetical protein
MTPLERPALPRDELLLRGISTADWNRDTLDPFFFDGNECSVSRRTILPLEEILNILRIHLRRPYGSETPTEQLWGYALIQIGNLEDWTNACIAKQKKDRATPIKAVADPITEPPPANPAHALIVPKITKGLSRFLHAMLIQRQEIFQLEQNESGPDWIHFHPPTAEQEQMVSTPATMRSED